MNFQIGLKPPDGTRLVWHSETARRLWQPRLQHINEEWARVERESVAQGIRPLTLQALRTGFQYEQVVQWARNRGLYVRPVRAVGYWEGFAHHYKEGNDLFVTAIASSLDALEAPEKHLGYPDCCQAFFGEYFPAVIDPIWQWAGEQAEVTASGYSNPMLRYYNIRFAPHIPCSIGCQESIHLGMMFKSLMQSDAAEWVEELLFAPLEWNCYRGVAIVLTEHFRLIVGSNPTSQPYIVRSNYGRAKLVSLGRA